VVKIIIGLIAIQFFIFLFTIKDKSVRLSVSTRACTHLSITVVKPGADPRGRAIGAIGPPKTYESNVFTMILNNSENSIRNMGHLDVHYFVTAVL